MDDRRRLPEDSNQSGERNIYASREPLAAMKPVLAVPALTALYACGHAGHRQHEEPTEVQLSSVFTAVPMSGT